MALFSPARVREFGSEVAEEIRKVTWPDWPQLKNATFVIILFVLFVAFLIWVMDVGVRGVLQLVLNLFAG